MRELGLLRYWMRQYTIKADLHVSRCTSIIHSKETEPEKQLDRKPLTLGSLSSAFLLLFIGLVMAKLAFVFEIIKFRNSVTRKVATKMEQEIAEQSTEGEHVIVSSPNLKASATEDIQNLEEIATEIE